MLYFDAEGLVILRHSLSYKVVALVFRITLEALLKTKILSAFFHSVYNNV